jgi:hypothetical protein
LRFGVYGFNLAPSGKASREVSFELKNSNESFQKTDNVRLRRMLPWV